MMDLPEANRRYVLSMAAALSGVALANRDGVFARIAANRLFRTRGSQSKLSILVLGGTGFIGPHLVRYACTRGHRMTIFTRGRRTADLPAEVVRLLATGTET